MLITFSTTTTELKRLDRGLLEDRVSAILRAHRHGAHLAVFGRDEARWLLDELSLVSRDRAELTRLNQQITLTGDLSRRASLYIRVVAPGTPIGFSSDSRALQLPIDHSCFDKILERPVFVVEDVMADLPVFDFVFKNTLSPKLRVSFEGVHGGGSRTWDVATLKAQDWRIVVAVADSDRKSPFASRSKAERARRIVDGLGLPFFFCEVTPCREIENALGLQVIGELPQVAVSLSFSSLTSISSSEASLSHPTTESFEWHFDLKEGLTPEKIEAITDSADRDWIEAKLTLAALSPTSAFLPGFGSRLLSEVFSSERCMAEFRRTIHSRRWQEMFGGFIARIMWIFAAAELRRT